jgi:predicted ATPase/uncharacterized protein HemY
MAAQKLELIGGRYRLGELIGRGAGGTVYRAVDVESGDVVAAKILDASAADDAPAMLARLQTEGTVLGELRHPSIVRLVQVLEHAGRTYLVMEYVSGGSLKDLLLRESQLPVERAVAIGLDLADALACAHNAGVLHRDVKPSNILLAEDGTPRLSDFGVALMAGTAMRQGGEGAGGQGGGSSAPPRPRSSARAERVGTLAYMSPEAYRGEEPGPESDVWSLGAVLYEMLAGRLPYEERQSVPAADTPVPPVGVFRPDVPDDVGALVREMLEADRARRTAGAGEVATRLEAVLTRRGTAAGGPGAGPGALSGYGTRFVGREVELEALARHLRDEARGPTSLVGPGGVGKSRLAAEAAERTRDGFPDGVWFVPLGSLSSPAHIVTAIAAAIGFAFHGPSDPRTQLINYLREKRLLMVLDNFEHLLEGAALLEDILAAGPQVRLLITSRELLGLHCETVVEVAGLGLPNAGAERPEDSDAVRLFLDCAAVCRPEFCATTDDLTQIVCICELVEGMPLGIELAAAWVGDKSCARIASEIGSNLGFLSSEAAHLSERHRSLRAVFDHSWHLLRESERRAFARLSVFRGGFSLSAARRVAGVSKALLSALVGKSLLRVDASGRYGLHELLRQYAEERLEARRRDAEESNRLHATYYAGFLREREDALRGRAQHTAVKEIGGELANVRKAWTWAASRGDAQCVATCLEGLYGFYVDSNLFAEGIQVFTEASESLGRDADELTLASLDARLGVFCECLSRHGEAAELLQRSLRVLRELGPERDVAFCLSNLGLVHSELGAHEEAERYLSESVTVSRRIKDRHETARALLNWGRLARHMGAYERASELCSEGLSIYEDIGHLRGMTAAIINLGNISYLLGDYQQAERYYRQGLDVSRAAGDRRGYALYLANLGHVAHEQSRYADAIRLRRESLEIQRQIGERSGMVGILDGLGRTACDTGAFRESEDYFKQAVRLATEIGATPLALHVLTGVACLRAQQGRTAEAFRCIAVVLRHPAASQASRCQAEELRDELLAESSKGRTFDESEPVDLEDVVEELLQ